VSADAGIEKDGRAIDARDAATASVPGILSKDNNIAVGQSAAAMARRQQHILAQERTGTQVTIPVARTVVKDRPDKSIERIGGFVPAYNFRRRLAFWWATTR